MVTEKQKQIAMDLRGLAVRMANMALNMRELYPLESAGLQDTSLATAMFADKIMDAE